jgi:hypothetical protein
MGQKNGQTTASNPVRPGDSLSFLRERQALSSFLASGEFNRSPNLEKILVYLCEQYFQGRSNLVKEYSIATEALGRDTSFDPKKDSIVRVELHRLRRRLKEYRNGKGANDAVWFDLPEKTYTPSFHFTAELISVPNRSGLVSASAPNLGETNPDLAPPPPHHQNPPPTSRPPLAIEGDVRRQWPWILAALGVVSAIGLLWLSPWRSPATASPVAKPAEALSFPSPDESALTQDGEIRILAGRPGARFVDRYGQVWLSDTYFKGGVAVAIPREVRSWGLDPNLFASIREGDFEYEIPVENKPHELMLFFAESMYGERNPLGGGESSRPFHVRVNGKVVLENFDVIADAGDASSMTARVFRDIKPGPDGKVKIRFESSAAAKAFVNAIQLRPGLPGALRPVRIVCRPQQFRDAKGNVWQPDSFYKGGQQITRPHGAPLPVDSEVYRGERYGRFTYSIPVTPGSYTVRLYFWEYWWGGAGHPGNGGVGSRRFNVFANFKPLLENFDIIAATGKDQWIVKTFSGLKPNGEGKISLEFVPLANYAMVNAIEVIDEAAR